MTEDKFKVSLVYLIPVLASLLFGLVCAYVLLPQQSQLFSTTIIPEETPGAPIGNALYFVVLIAVSATVFYFLLKRKSKRIIKALILLAMTMASMLLSIVYLNILLAGIPNYEFLLIPLSLIITVLFDLAIFKYTKARNVAVIGLGGALGIFFGFSIPLWSGLVILVFLAVYDVIAVYRGPVGKIAQSGLDDLQGLSYSFKDIQMGLGDLVFYSMLTGLMVKAFAPSLFPVIASIIGILVGSIITLLMLEKRGVFPGLPFPIALGLAGGLITALALGFSIGL